MEQKVKAYIEDNHILRDVNSVVLAVSGGADSMALTHFMAVNYPQYDYIVAHVNHGLRPEAKDEELLVAEFARQLNLDFVSVEVNVAAEARLRRKGLEETGREVRYDFFRSLNRDIILTAHHRDDRAESILLHLIRGSGIAGLRGIIPLTNKIGRPFLSVSKEEILTYCADHSIAFSTDLSNEDITYRRNKVRHQVLPLLAEINPNISDTLCRLGDIAGEDESFLASLASKIYAEEVREDGGKLVLSSKALSYSKSLVRRLIMKMAQELGSPIDYAGVEKIIKLGAGKKYFWGNGAGAWKNGNCLVLSAAVDSSAENWSVVLPFEGSITIAEKNMEVSITHNNQKRPNKNNRAVFDHEVLTEELTLRNRRNGDWFYLPGGGRKKLSDFFIDEKIPFEIRDNIPLLCQGSRVLWIVGYRQCVAVGKGEISVSLKKF